MLLLCSRTNREVETDGSGYANSKLVTFYAIIRNVPKNAVASLLSGLAFTFSS